jgi:hypothetical protein
MGRIGKSPFELHLRVDSIVHLTRNGRFSTGLDFNKDVVWMGLLVLRLLHMTGVDRYAKSRVTQFSNMCVTVEFVVVLVSLIDLKSTHTKSGCAL